VSKNIKTPQIPKQEIKRGVRFYRFKFSFIFAPKKPLLSSFV